jgi:hypothetical protein
VQSGCPVGARWLDKGSKGAENCAEKKVQAQASLSSVLKLAPFFHFWKAPSAAAAAREKQKNEA